MADYAHAAPDGEIAYVDEQPGVSSPSCERRGLYDGTLDRSSPPTHGEDAGRHGGWWHGTTIYDEQIAVPLVVKPRVASAGESPMPVSTSLDVAPTIHRAVGLAPAPTMQIVSCALRRSHGAAETAAEQAASRGRRASATRRTARSVAPSPAITTRDDGHLAARRPGEREDDRGRGRPSRRRWPRGAQTARAAARATLDVARRRTALNGARDTRTEDSTDWGWRDHADGATRRRDDATRQRSDHHQNDAAATAGASRRSAA